MSLLDSDMPASAHVVADTILDLNALYREDLERIKEEHPELIVEMHKSVGRAKYFNANQSGAKKVSVEAQLSQRTDFSAQLIMAVQERVMKHEFTRGQPIIRLQDPPDGVFFVVQGAVVVSVPDPSTQGATEINVRKLQAGAFFGELSLLLDRPISADVTACPELGCTVQVLTADDYDRLRVEFPELSSCLGVVAMQQRYQELSPFNFPVPLFKELPATLINKLIAVLRQQDLKEGETLVTEGEPARSMFFVASGEFEALSFVPPCARR